MYLVSVHGLDYTSWTKEQVLKTLLEWNTVEQVKRILSSVDNGNIYCSGTGFELKNNKGL